MPLRELQIAVVGAGPGGLAAGIALQQVQGIKVTIYEQASILREVGAGISIGKNTWNGKTGEELHRVQKATPVGQRLPIRTQRTHLQSALLAHVDKHTIELGRRVCKLEDLGSSGVRLTFSDGSSVVADLVIGADGIRSVVRDSAWTDFKLSFTGTTIWRVLLPWTAVKDLDSRFETTAWWHGPTTHVYFSPVGEGLWEIAARAWQDPAIHSACKVSWGTPIGNDEVVSHFTDYLPQIREALSRVPPGAWREFAAFAGPELSTLTNWNNKVVLVGDSSHALSGAFGSGAGFGMEDAWVLAQSLKMFENNLDKALPLFNKIRVPYFSKMYAHLAAEAQRRSHLLAQYANPTEEERVRVKIIKAGGKDMSFIYENNIARVWAEHTRESQDEPEILSMVTESMIETPA